ncbi:MAG: immunoglobulin domain-containing protein, partial [Candidatus Hydrogenedentales bacterium]
YIGDVGQNTVEEIDFEDASSTGGNNYGWDLLEGSQDFECVDCDAARNSTVLPIHEYVHGAGRSVNGGYVYRGSEFPSLQGRYFFSDFNGLVWSFEFDGSNVTDFQEHTEEFGTAGSSLVSFGEDAAGELYIVDIGGNVFRIVVAGPDVGPITGTRLLEEGGVINLSANVTGSVGVTTFAWLKDGGPLSNGGSISGTDTPTLTISPALISDSGSYALDVMDEAKATTISEPVLITVVAAGSLPAVGPLLWTLLVAMVLVTGMARYIGRASKI